MGKIDDDGALVNSGSKQGNVVYSWYDTSFNGGNFKPRMNGATMMVYDLYCTGTPVLWGMGNVMVASNINYNGGNGEYKHFGIPDTNHWATFFGDQSAHIGNWAMRFRGIRMGNGSHWLFRSFNDSGDGIIHHNTGFASMFGRIWVENYDGLEGGFATPHDGVRAIRAVTYG